MMKFIITSILVFFLSSCGLSELEIKIIQAVSVLGKLVETHCTTEHIAAINKSKSSKDMLIRIDPNKHKLGFGGYSLSQDQMCHRAALRAIRTSYEVCDNYPDECAAVGNGELKGDRANKSKIDAWISIYNIMEKNKYLKEQARKRTNK